MDSIKKDLRDRFLTYLKIRYPYLKSPETPASDAFFPYEHLYKNDMEQYLFVLQQQQYLSILKKELLSYFEEKNRKRLDNGEAEYASTPEERTFGYLSSIQKFKEFIMEDRKDLRTALNALKERSSKALHSYKALGKNEIRIPIPCKTQIDSYLKKWGESNGDMVKERALDILFRETFPVNTSLEQVLLKVSVLNNFYSTYIYDTYSVAKNIVKLNIDERLAHGDVNLVEDISKVERKNKIVHLYSFATKYCSFHKPSAYPIYDRYIAEVLYYFNKKDSFAKFRKADLRDYKSFKEVLFGFQKFYSLPDYSYKEIDQYLWLVGKENFSLT